VLTGDNQYHGQRKKVGSLERQGFTPIMSDILACPLRVEIQTCLDSILKSRSKSFSGSLKLRINSFKLAGD
jgi:hypothetical protein